LEKKGIERSSFCTAGGKASVDTFSGSSLNNPGIGGTLGYQFNPDMQMNLVYSSTINNTTIAMTTQTRK
jgi:hypothetical protein